MRLGILGPVEIRDGGENLVPPRRRARALLGMLSLRANTAVPVEWIIDGLWGERPPQSAAVNLRSYICDLRKVLRPESGVPPPEPGGPWIRSGHGRYTLTVRPDGLDALGFENLAADGRRCLAAGEHELAVERLTRAVGLWRGPVLDGVPVPDAVRPLIQRLDERRVDAIEDCVQARLALGQDEPLAAELPALTAEHPLRERLWGQRMLALVRRGRQGEAVRVYHRLVRLLDEELGVEPSQQIQRLYLRILRADPDLHLPPAGRAVARSRRAPVPWQLPPDVTAFVGRAAHLRSLHRAALVGDRTAVVITAVSGTAGVGKTALAVHWAHAVRHRFPDGCLYVDLRGYGPERPLEPAEALTGFLRALGAGDVGGGIAELAARYRTLLADRRVLVVLDNARSTDQVRPLLPGTAGCLVVVTSRDDLAGLVARDGARRIELDLMPAGEAVELLRGLIGERVDADPGAATALALRCARLPLALRIAAELAGRRPERSLASLVDELAGRQRSLDLLDAGGDRRTAIRAVFDWSYGSLAAPAAAAFRLLGQHPGRDFDAYSLAALAGTALDQAHRLLDELLRAHLVQHGGGPGRYGMHDLLRAYASDCEPDVAALTRLFDHYAGTAMAAEALHPRGRGRQAQVPPAAAPAPRLNDLAAATAWLEAERSNLVAVAVHCARHGWPAHACELSQALRPYLDGNSHFLDALTVHGHALRAARQLGDRLAEGAALNNLGAANEHLGRYPDAIAQLEQALAIRRELGDRHGEIRTANNLAIVYNRLGRYREAVEHYQRSLLISFELDDPASEGMVLANLGFVYYRLARYQEAIGCHERALAVFRRIGDRALEGVELGNLGVQYARLGRYREAIEHGAQALAISREVGDRGGEGFVRGNLGAVHTELGDHRAAREHLERALAIHSEVGDRAAEAAVLVYLGELMRRVGHHDEALHHHQRALDLDRELGDRYQEAEALTGIAATYLAMDNPGPARAYYESALAVSRRAGHPHEEANALAGLGRALHAAGDLVTAEEHLRAAAVIYAGIGVVQPGESAAVNSDHPGRPRNG